MVPDLLYQYVCCLELTGSRYLASEVFLWSSSLRNLNNTSLLAESFRNRCHSDLVGREIWGGGGGGGGEPLFDEQQFHHGWCVSVIWEWKCDMCPTLHRLVCNIMLSKNGNNCICVYSPKSDARWGFTMWMIADILNRTTVDSTEASLRPGLGIAGRQFRSVDLVPDINFFWLDKAGGSRWLSWW